MTILTTTLSISGMHCNGCERIVERKMLELPGVIHASSSFQRGMVRATFDSDKIDQDSIEQALEENGYTIIQQRGPKPKSGYNTVIFLVLLLVVGGLAFWGKGLMPQIIPQLNSQMSSLMLFTIGILTGFHCIGMCGGFIVSYTNANHSLLRSISSHLQYGAGKTLSYTFLGSVFGAIGAAFTITVPMQFTVAILSGLFLVLYGAKMLQIFPSLNFVNIKLPSRFSGMISSKINHSKTPFTIGILNGFMLGCGPLQAMYILAAGTGSPTVGATLLFFFGLGTLLPLLSFGMFASYIPPKTMHELVRVSGVLVVLMGGMMLNRGISLLA